MTLKEDILTNRLILYRPRTEHLSAVYEIHADPRTNVFNPRGAIDEVGEASAMLVHWHGYIVVIIQGFAALVNSADADY